MKIYIASDHAGFELKKILIEDLQNSGHDVEDFGAYDLDPADDYPDFVVKVASAVAAASETRGIVIGGSGQGEAMACNRVKGARAAVYYGKDLDMVRITREDNDTNILSLGARFMSVDEGQKAVQIFLETAFSEDERHVRRLAKF